MSSDTVSARLPGSTKARLQQLAKSTGRRGALLAAEAIEEYLDINEWRVPGLLSASPPSIAAKASRMSVSRNKLPHGRRAVSAAPPGGYDARLVSVAFVELAEAMKAERPEDAIGAFTS
jgi:hypothetical protein